MAGLKKMCGGGLQPPPCVAPGREQLPTRSVRSFLTAVESFLFYYIFTKTPTKDLERSFSVWAHELRSIGELQDEGVQRAQLDTFVADRFQKSMSTKEKELQDALDGKGTRFPIGGRPNIDAGGELSFVY